MNFTSREGNRLIDAPVRRLRRACLWLGLFDRALLLLCWEDCAGRQPQPGYWDLPK